MRSSEPSPYPARRIEEYLLIQAERDPGHIAMLFYGRTVTYGETARAALSLAAYLQSSFAVKPGDFVALDCQNSPQFVIAYYGILLAGAVVVPLNPMYRAAEVARIARDAGISVAIVAADLLDRVSCWPGSEALRIVVVNYADYLPDEPSATLPDVLLLPMPDLVGDLRLVPWRDAVRDPAKLERSGQGAEALCVMPYTSGSTGRPKGCPHTHRAVLHTAAAQAEWYRFTTDSVLSAVQPLFHVAGMQSSLNGGILAGATVMIMTRWDADVAIRLFAAHGVTFWNAPPTMVVDMLSRSGFDSEAFTALRVVTGGGSAMPKAVAATMRERFGLSYVEGYGMTETMSPTHLNPVDAPRFGSIGIPIGQTVAFVVDPETLDRVPAGMVGEIVVAGPQVIAGYWRNPEADLEAFVDIDGLRMLRTGDLGYVDPDGYFHVVDRLKRMINASGFKVWPAEIEEVLFGHPAVQQCCVIGAPDPYRGETVRAVIVPRPDHCDGTDSEAIRAWLALRLAAFKVPREVVFVDSLPVTSSHKVDWRRVQDAAAGSV